MASQQHPRVIVAESSLLDLEPSPHAAFLPLTESYLWTDHQENQSLTYTQEVSSFQSPAAPNSSTQNGTAISSASLSAMFTSPTEFSNTMSYTRPLRDALESSNQLLHQTNLETSYSQKPQSSYRRRPKYSSSEWEKYKAHIKRVYIIEDKSLDETMKTMGRIYGFNPSIKLYKEKFKEWNWSKNLPRARAQWMLKKAQERKRHPGEKDTVFRFGDRLWTVERIQKSNRRTKDEEHEAPDPDAPTPFDIKYETPKNDHPSPCNLRSPGNSRQPPGRWTPAPNPSTARVSHLQLTWQGHSRAEIEAMSQEAYQLEHLGHVEEAEKKYRDALAGLQNLLPQAHEDTSKAAYQLATFYAQHDRMNDADLVLNWMGEEYMKRWGLEHDNTMNHFLNVAELFHNWSRPDDAITILYRVLDKLETEPAEDPGDTAGPNVNTITKGQPQVPLTQHTASQSQAEKATGSSTLENQRAFVDYHLGLADSHVRAKDETAEPLLLHLIERCEAHPEILAEQALHARCALVKLYRELGKHQQMDTVLDEAKNQLWKHLDSKEKKTQSLLEISLGIARLNVEGARYDVAEEIFQRTGCEAEDTFGTDHKITIATFIRIGKIYQSENRWNDAQPWFEQALNASMTANGLESRQTKALEAALENQHYSLPMPQSEDLAALLRCRKLEGDI